MSNNPDISAAVTGHRRFGRRRLRLVVTGLGAGIAAAGLVVAFAGEYWQDMRDRSH